MANSVWQATIQNAAGDIVGGAEITVIDEGTGLNATIFSSKAGAALTNPFNADVGGFAQFYSGPGEYRITAFDIGTGLTQTFDNWRLGDAGARDSQTSFTDLTPNSLMVNGAWGLGGGIISTEVNLDDYPFGSIGIITPAAGVINGPPGVTVVRGVVNTSGYNTYASQSLVLVSGETYTRNIKGTLDTWTAWEKTWNEVNYQPSVISNPLGVVRFMINKTGGNVLNGAIIEGNDLDQARGNSVGAILSSGNPGLAGQFWKAVGGYTTLSNSAGLFVRET